MKIIYKYPVEPGENIIEIPAKSQFLSFGFDAHRKMNVWYLTPMEECIIKSVKLTIVGTGWELENNDFFDSNFLGTVASEQSGLVWHLFRD